MCSVLVNIKQFLKCVSVIKNYCSNKCESTYVNEACGSRWYILTLALSGGSGKVQKISPLTGRKEGRVEKE